jgi:uncharacterized protein (DUF1778 family)
MPPSRFEEPNAKFKGLPSSEATAAKNKDALSLRIDQTTRGLIDKAAEILGQTRTEFMLTSARERATEVVLNQTLFRLSGTDWTAFTEALDNPPPANAELKALLARKAPWDT